MRRHTIQRQSGFNLIGRKRFSELKIKVRRSRIKNSIPIFGQISMRHSPAAPSRWITNVSWTARDEAGLGLSPEYVSHFAEDT